MLQWVLTYHESSCLQLSWCREAAHAHVFWPSSSSDLLKSFPLLTDYLCPVCCWCLFRLINIAISMIYESNAKVMSVEQEYNCIHYLLKIKNNSLKIDQGEFLRITSKSLVTNLPFSSHHPLTVLIGFFCKPRPLSDRLAHSFIPSPPLYLLTHLLFCPHPLLSLLSLFLSAFLSICFSSGPPHASHGVSFSALCVPNQLSWLHNRRMQEKGDE